MIQTQIHIKGKISRNWSDWFEGLQVQASPSGETILYGRLADNSAVYGILSRLSSLGLTLISVACQDENGPDPPR